MNENKVPCGGFAAGAGLKVEDGKVSVNGGVETQIWCKMTPQTSDTSADLGYCYINEIRVTDADYNELWSFTPETPKKRRRTERMYGLARRKRQS